MRDRPSYIPPLEHIFAVITMHANGRKARRTERTKQPLLTDCASELLALDNFTTKGPVS